jgi:hypothetical protein
MGILDKNFDTVTGFHLFVDTPSGGGNTTVSAAAAAGANSLSITSATNFAIGDDIRVGSGETAELVRIQNLVSTTVTTQKPLLFDHPIGDAVVEQSALNLGVPEGDGARFSATVENTDVFSAMQRLLYGTLVGYADMALSWRYMAITADVMAVALGLPRASVIGDGTAAAQTGTVGPRLFTTDGVTMGGLINACAVVTGVLNDGATVKATFNGLSFNPTAFTATFARGQLSTVPVQALCTSATWDFSVGTFTPANIIQTFASSNADLFAEMVSVQELTDSGTTSTLSAGVAAGVYSVTLASASGFVAGDWVRIGTGSNAEYHLVHGVVTNTLNFRTQVLRAIASGVTVVKQNAIDVGGIEGGFTIATPGQVTVQRSETSRMSLKNRVGNISAQLSFNATNVTPETLQRAFGIAASAYASSVLPMTNATFAKALSRTFVFNGLTQGARKITICGWNGTCQASGEINMTQAANLTVPIAYKPNVLQAFVNA